MIRLLPRFFFLRNLSTGDGGVGVTNPSWLVALSFGSITRSSISSQVASNPSTSQTTLSRDGQTSSSTTRIWGDPQAGSTEASSDQSMHGCKGFLSGVIDRASLVSVQGTCEYGTRVDYMVMSPDSPCKFVPGSYSVVSSKGKSDQHILKVDLVKSESSPVVQENEPNKGRHKWRRHPERVVKISSAPPSRVPHAADQGLHSSMALGFDISVQSVTFQQH
ncbi:hypothetical protein MLD38_039915 [Melastoma candidum]|uniref:Uncharacterized protein n=1 Tax=Melastoma candidum TaxID=119954 RepID=A0ACB9L4C2_9MYRT|nr:hypothetical protein MLD38_039915 [Melastoma candidum]